MTVTARRARTIAPWLYSFGLAALILGPLLGPGYLLVRDAVSTPRSYATDTALGLGDAAARAVPQDLLLAVTSTVVDGGLVMKLLLLGALTAAGAGAAVMVRALLPTAGLGAQLVAATVTLWNPYVAERLLQGHWSLLLGYAALPWTVCAAVAIRRGHPGGWWALGAALAVAGITPTGVLLATIVAAVTLGSWRRQAALAALFLLASAPWLITIAIADGGGTSDPGGVAAFAARAEPALATIGSLAGLGGIWNSQAVPDSRTTLFALVGTVILLAVIACGVPALWRRRRHPVIVALAVLAAVAVVLPALAATPWGIAVGSELVDAVPGAGLARDAQKWVALAVPAYACAGAAAVLPRRRGPLANRRTRIGATVGAIILILLALPDLGWGVGGKLKPVTYSPQWREVTAHVANDPGDVVVLPAGMFRIIGGQPALDPTPRMLPANVLQSGELIVGGQSVRGEGVRGTQAEEILLTGAAPDALADLGVRWVLLWHLEDAELGAAAATLTHLEPVLAGEQLALYRVPGDVHSPTAGPGARTAALAAHAVWAGLLVIGLVGSAVTAYRTGPFPTRRRYQP